LKAALAVYMAAAGVGRSLAAVLTPDNEGLPRGTLLSTKARGRALEFEVTSGSLSASLSTVLALLRDIALFEEVWLLSSQRRGRVRRADLG